MTQRRAHETEEKIQGEMRKNTKTIIKRIKVI